ncbi:hypothetical protein [Bradyrhizobium sp. CCGE-LA001]|uniref:hypothetical protein n=1 Tax=Bradyrhizobium sp. CCGE-LA001 TaxID=1223566 RepID=UPI0002AAC00B|nr:hypothetical protein [Bradyrhizobium sp. CCGE-LA001]AMA55757.1 hypothetical protein BCCGELA001_05405 [Bradyrhizobium sp. CCGE-LA001]
MVFRQYGDATYRIAWTSEGERIAREIADAEKVSDATDELVIVQIAERNLKDMEQREDAVEFLVGAFRKHWEITEDICAWEEEKLRRLLTEVQSRVWQHRIEEEAQLHQKVLEDEKRRKMARAKAAARERAEKEARVRSAKLTRQIAKEFGCTTRQALNMRNEGTTDPTRATRLAEILGGDPEVYLRRRRRRRTTDLVPRITGIELEEASFFNFLSEELDRAGAGDMLKSFQMRKDEMRWWNPKSLEELLQQGRLLGLEGNLLSEAEHVWKSLQVWRIATICRVATHEITEGI